MVQPRKFVLLGGFVLLVATGGCVNRPPTLNCATERTTLTEGQSVTINSNASDPNKNDQLTFSWSTTDGKITSQNGLASFDSTGLKPGSYTVELEVRDPKQNTATCSIDLQVEKNKQAPTIACESASPTVTEGQSTTLQARAFDPNNDSLTYTWAVDGQAVSNDQPSFTFGTSGRSVGAHSARVTVTDVDGMSANCNFNVTIARRPNLNPTVSLALDKKEVYAGEILNARAEASDPEGDPLSYSWSVDSQSRAGTAAQLAINTSGLSGGTHSATVSVRDDREGTGTATQSFSVREKILVQMPGTRLDNIGKAKLDEVALKLQRNRQLKVLATGHTDNVGSEGGNERMGQRRAEAVSAYLVKSHNIDTSRIETKSAGESQPIADNKTAQGRQENRRVEVEIFAP